MLKKWFISAFTEIQKISQNLGPKLGQKLKKLNLQWKGASDPQNLREPFFDISKDISMLKKWFISAFPEILKISKNLGPKLSQKLKKWNVQWKGASDPQNISDPFFAFSKDITMLKKWFVSAFPEIQKISQNLGPNLGQKLIKLNLQWKGASDQQNLTEPFFTFSKGITMLKKWFISAFPEIQKISQNLGPKLGQKLKKIESSIKRCIGSAKYHRTVFRYFERYYDAKEGNHKRISSNPENISKSGPKFRPKILKNWILMKRCIGSAKHHRTVFRFFERYYDAKEVIHTRISWNPENI